MRKGLFYRFIRYEKSYKITVFGVAIAIFALCGVMFAKTIVSDIFIDDRVERIGNTDFVLTSNEVFDTPNFQHNLIKETYPRLFFKFDYKNYYDKEFAAIDTQKEFTDLMGVNSEGIFNDFAQSGLGMNECVMSYGFYLKCNISTGDEISITIHYEEYSIERNLTVVGFYDLEDSMGINIKIIVEHSYFLTFLYDELGINLEGKSNFIAYNLDRDVLNYDLVNLYKTEKVLIDFGEDLIDFLGTYDGFEFLYPINSFLEENNMIIDFGINTAILVVVVMVLLFNSFSLFNFSFISIKKQIHNYALQRVVGNSRKRILIQTIGKTAMIGVGATIIGIVGFVIVILILVPVMNYVLGSSIISISFIQVLQVILNGILLGGLSSILISMIPSFIVYRSNLIQSLNPERIESDSLEKDIIVKKESWIFALGIIFIFVGINTYWIFPLIVNSMQFWSILFYMTEEIIISFTIVLLGFMLISIVFFNKFVEIFTRMIKPITRNLSKIIKSSILTHRKKNIALSLSFMFSFCLVTFAASISTTFEQHSITNLTKKGGDIIISNNGFDSNTLTKFQNIPEIISGCYIIDSLIGINNKYNGEDFSFQYGDLSGVTRFNANFLAFDDKFFTTTIKCPIRLIEGNIGEIKTNFFDTDQINILIDNVVANELNLHLDGDIRLIFTRNGLSKIYLANIIGIYSLFPATEPASMTESRNHRIIISTFHFTDKFDLESSDDAIYTKILLDCNDAISDSQFFKDSTRQLIAENNWKFMGIEFMMDNMENTMMTFRIIKVGLSGLIFIIILLSLSNLITSFLSLLYERKNEIMSYRAIGLSMKDVNRLLFFELFTLLTINMITGILIASITTYIFISLGGLIFDMIIDFYFPSEILLIECALSYVTLILFYTIMQRRANRPKKSENTTPIFNYMKRKEKNNEQIS